MRAASIAACAALGAGCIQLNWGRESRYSPVEKEAIARLEAGHTELTGCLEQFGAPLWVWESVEDGRPSAALAYGWFDEKDLGLRISVPVTDYASASVDYDRIDQRMKGLVLFFDADWRLVSWRTGLLRDLTRERRRPPAALEEDL